jgi:ATP/maltotriose-dependent transcriptional regulator MalT
MNWFLDHMPDNCTVILATRTMPELPYLRLTARQEIAGLGSLDLAFSGEEVRAYLQLNHNLDLPAEEADRLASETEGWITAILLGTHTLWKGLLRTMVAARGRDAQVFDYLAQEVFDNQPERVRRFLKSTSLLSVLRASFCDRLLGAKDSAALLDELERRNLFVTRLSLPEKTYRYHALFQDFLLRQFPEDHPEERTKLLQKAARLSEKEGDIEGAIDYFLAAEDKRSATRLIKSQIEDVYQSGRLVTAAAWLDSIASEVAVDPGLAVMRGRLHRQKGEFDQALRFFDTAAALYAARGDLAGHGGARVREAVVYRHRGEISRAREICEDVLALANEAGLDPRSEALAQRILGEAMVLSGDLTESKRSFRRALRLFERAGDRYQIVAVLQALGTTARLMGNPLEAEGHYKRALRLTRALGNRWRAAEIQNNIGVGYYYQGEYAKAESTLLEALAEARAVGHARTVALVLVGLGDIAMDLGDLRRAQDYYQEGLEGSRSVGDVFLETYTLCAMSRLDVLDRAWESAESLLEEAERAAARNATGYTQGLILFARGQLRLAEGRPDDGRRDLEASAGHLDSAGARRELARARAWLGFAHYLSGDRDQSVDMLGKAIEFCMDSAHPHLLVPDGVQMLDYFEEARRHDKLRQRELETLLTRIHQFTLSIPVKSSESPPREILPPRIHITALGSTAVKVDGRAIPQSAWGGPLVRDLFFYLLEHGAARREAILDAFWPDYSTAKAKEVFHASMYRMRRVLPKATIVFDAATESYAVDSAGDFWYDVAAFEQLVRRSDADTQGGVGFLREAAAIYRGDFLPQCGAEWARARREALRSSWVDALARLAIQEASRGDHRAAIEALRRAVREEPYREDLRRDLMTNLAGAGRHAEALLEYRVLRDTLKKDLDVGPAAETAVLYDEIRRAVLPKKR